MPTPYPTGASGDDPDATSIPHDVYTDHGGLNCEEAGRIASLLWSFVENTRDLDDISRASFLSLSQAVAARLSRTGQRSDNISWDPRYPRETGIVDEPELSANAEKELEGQITSLPDRFAWLTTEEGEFYQTVNGKPRREPTWYGLGGAAEDLYELLKTLPREIRAASMVELLRRVEESYHERGAKKEVTQWFYEEGLLTKKATEQWREAQNLDPGSHRPENHGYTTTEPGQEADAGPGQEEALDPEREGGTEPGHEGDAEGGECRGPQEYDEDHKRDGALGYGKPAESDDEKSGSAPTDADSGVSESMWKSHVGGFLREKVPGPKPVSDVLGTAVDRLDLGKYRPVLRWHLAHVYYCQTRMPNCYSDGVPVSYQLLKQACRELGVEVPTRTKKIWEAAEAAGILHVTDHIYREGDIGRSREYRISESLLRHLDEALADSYEYKTRYSLVDGKRLYSGFQTELTYDGEHSWKERSTFIYRVLKRLKGQRDLVNKEAVEDHLDRLQQEFGEADATYREAVGVLERLKDEILEEGKSLTPSEKERLSQARERAQEAGRELDRVDSRYRQDLRLWSDIVAQGLEEAEDQPEGVFEYKTAWEVQEASGRLTCLCGLQNASEEMKAAAAKGIPEYNNFDIKSSQTEALIQEMEMAVRMGADLDLSVIKDYAENDGKDGLADEHGIHRDRWKRPEHSVKFGAGFNHDTFAESRAAAEGRVLARIENDDGEPDFSKLHQHEHESGKAAYERAVYNELPTMAAVARDWADDEEIQYDDPEEIYTILKGAYADMAEELDAWRDWLVDEYWTEAGRHGSAFGYFVSNPCSIPFSIYDARLAESGDEPDRYNQKTGFATSRLQGREAAYIHALTLIQDDFDYEFLRNEHDGAVVIGEIPDEAREMARRISGFHRANLEKKPFEGHDDASDSKNAEDQTCNTKTSKRLSGQSPQEKPSKSRTSQSEEASGGGSAGGTTAQGGANAEKTRSGSPRPSPVPCATISGTTSKDSAPSDSSTGSPPTSASNTSSEGTTGSTSQREWSKGGLGRAPPDIDCPERSTKNCPR
jgi:hypothetical protein